LPLAPIRLKPLKKNQENNINSQDFISLLDSPPKSKKPVAISEPTKIAQRQRRFASGEPDIIEDTSFKVTFNTTQHIKPKFTNIPSKPVLTEEDWEDMVVVGTCTKLEKNYLRLTSAPEPNQVRPEPILRQALEIVKEKWIQTKDWVWCCEQLKSLRQDLTVQQIKNAFTAQAYELHARLCLENGDIGEYNQCQSQLLTLYSMKIPGSKMEFISYRILYSIYEDNSLNANKMLAELTPEMRKDPAVSHALKVRQAFAMRNYHAFFKLYFSASNMGYCIMEFVFDKLRLEALSKYTKIFRPELEVSFLQRELAFDSIQNCRLYLDDHYCIFTSPKKEFVCCKESFLGLKQWEKEFQERHRLEDE